MKKLTHSKGIRKSKSNVGAVGGGSFTAPGARAKGSPHGSNVRSWLTVTWHRADDGQPVWEVVRIDVEGELAIPLVTPLVRDVTLQEAAWELRNWCEALELPYRDYGSNRNEYLHDAVTCDPAAGWPL